MNKKEKIRIQNEYGNWKKCPKKGFPYTGIDDPKYLKERNELFAENGNGWWWFQGASQQQRYGQNDFKKRRLKRKRR